MRTMTITALRRRFRSFLAEAWSGSSLHARRHTAKWLAIRLEENADRLIREEPEEPPRKLVEELRLKAELVSRIAAGMTDRDYVEQPLDE